MSDNAPARVAQIGNLLTSPVFVAALLGLLANLAGPLGLHLTSDPQTQANAAIILSGLGVMLTHWYTGPVSIASTTLLPQSPMMLPPGTHTITVQGPPVPPPTTPPVVTVAPAPNDLASVLPRSDMNPSMPPGAATPTLRPLA